MTFGEKMYVTKISILCTLRHAKFLGNNSNHLEKNGEGNAHSEFAFSSQFDTQLVFHVEISL